MIVNQVWQAGRADAPEVSALLVEFRNWAGSNTPSDDSFRRSVEQLLEEPNTAFLLAAGSGGAPAAGVCQLRYRHSVWTGVDDCWLEDLYVRDNQRRAGVGRRLVLAACEHARGRGCRRIELDVNNENLRALGLYQSLGFSARSKQMGSDGSRDLFMGMKL